MGMDLAEYKQDIRTRIACQRAFFAGGKTKNADFRIQQLKKLTDAIVKYEEDILEALHKDLNKSYEEGFLTELSIVQSEAKLHIRKLKKWSKPRKVATPLHLWPSQSRIMPEPFGIALILSPWNYPFQLLMNPLIGAIAAGNCAILKPSPHSPATNKIVEKMVCEIFPPDYVCVIEGDSEQTGVLLEEIFDVIFFTGSPGFGKEVMRAAAAHLTPVILELGGKSPCIVDCGCNIELAAKRIVWGKLMNAGQTCIAPDYLLVHESLEKQMIDLLIQYIVRFYGEIASASLYYPRMITPDAFLRLKSYLNDGEIAYGGETDEEQRYISPTILRNLKPNSEVMEHEIFGPILPVITYRDLDEAVEYINSRQKPLALYYFGKEKKGEEVLRATSSGGACINDVLLHIANHNLPFGGVGNSGIGKYHGAYSFKAFSNERAVLKSSSWVDFAFKYVPFRFFPIVKKMI